MGRVSQVRLVDYLLLALLRVVVFNVATLRLPARSRQAALRASVACGARGGAALAAQSRSCG